MALSTLNSFLANMSPAMLTTITSAVTPELVKSYVASLTPTQIQQASMPGGIIESTLASVSPETVKTVFSALPQDTLNTISTVMTPELVKTVVTNLTPEVGSTVSSLFQYITGVDIASFSNSKTGLNINLEDGKVFSISGAQMGAFTHEINLLTGSKYNDVLTGDQSAETIKAGEGNDQIGGSKGADVLDGGTGSDQVSYGKSDFGVTVDLAFGRGLGGDAEGDQLLNIENVTGSNANDVLVGSTSANNLNGGNGNDSISAGAGNDTIEGGAGSDILNGGAGSDFLNGGAGVDTVSYENATSGVQVNLQLGFGQSGEATGDRYSGIENANGTNFNDTMIGNNGNNALNGGKGNDSFNGGSGADTIIGGDGTDSASYATSRAAVQVDLEGFHYMGGAAPTEEILAMSNVNGHGGDAEGDILVGVERLTGSAFNDSLSGDMYNNSIEGGLGNDTMNGRGGNDVLTGGAGNDTFTFGAYSGSDVVTDFRAGRGVGDVISFEDKGVTTYADLMTHATQVGKNLVFSFGDEKLTLQNVSLSQFSADDAVFATTPDPSEFGVPMMQQHSDGMLIG